MASKSKWVTKEDFKKVFGKKTTNLKVIPSIMTQGSPYQSPSHSPYRQTIKTQWISNKNFKL
jgi:hypothetical protein